jgi:carboxymethylenebutenolidase
MGEEIIVQTEGSEFNCFLSEPAREGKYPGLIIIHEIWGLNAHIKDVCERYAEQGYAVIAPDLLGDTGVLENMSPSVFADMQNSDKRTEAQIRMREIMRPISTPQFADSAVAKLKESFDYLLMLDSLNGKMGTLGFCLGGSYAFRLATKEKRLNACVAFYGQSPEPLDSVAEIECPVLAFYGENDKRLIDRLPELEEAMKKHGKDFTAHVYPNAGHAFFNDTNVRTYDISSARNAWRVSLDFLAKNLGVAARVS